MQVAKWSCNVHPKPREALRVAVRSGSEQNVTTTVGTSQPRVIKRSDRDPQLLSEDAEILLDSSGIWTSSLSTASYEQPTTACDSDEEMLLLLERRQRSTIEASTSQIVGAHSSGAHAARPHDGSSSHAGAKRAGVPLHAAVSMRVEQRNDVVEPHNVQHGADTTMHVSPNSTLVGSAAVLPSAAESQPQSSNLATLLQALELAATCQPQTKSASKLRWQRQRRKQQQHQQQQQQALQSHTLGHHMGDGKQHQRPLVFDAVSPLQRQQHVQQRQQLQPVVRLLMPDATLTRAICAARSTAELTQLYTANQRHMNMLHISVMMKRLARFVSTSASSKSFMSTEQSGLWSRLLDKALFTMQTAGSHQVVDMLAAIHHVVEVREQRHGGLAKPSQWSVSGRQQQLRQLEGQLQPQESAGLAFLGTHRPVLGSHVESEEVDEGEAAPAFDTAFTPLADGADMGSAEEPEGMLSSSPSIDTQVPNMEQPTVAVAQAAANSSAARGSESQQSRSAQAMVQAPQHLHPLHSSRGLHTCEKQLVKAAVLHSTELMVTRRVPQRDLLRLVAAVGRLGFSAGQAWQDAFFQSSLQSLPELSKADLVSLACGVARLQPTRIPSAAWMVAFYERSQQLMPALTARELSSLLVCAARLPRPYPTMWIESALQRCIDCLDTFDAPAYALLLHSLGRMRHRPPRPWVQELLESSATLLYDFSPEELSLVLRGCSMLRTSPDDQWLHEFYSLSLSQLRSCSGPQLANIGWSLALLRRQPPRQWLHAWLAEVRRKVQTAGRPLGVGRRQWHGIGYAVHAKRAVVAMEAFGVSDLDLWCRWLRTSMPKPRRGSGKM